MNGCVRSEGKGEDVIRCGILVGLRHADAGVLCKSLSKEVLMVVEVFCGCLGYWCGRSSAEG